MTAPYKKRAKAGWCGGKAYKKEANRSERIYESEDVAEQEREIEKHFKAKSKPSENERKIKQLLRDIKTALKISRGDIESLNVHGDSWLDGMMQEYYQKCKKAVPILQKHLEETEMTNKLRRNIEEILEKLK